MGAHFWTTKLKSTNKVDVQSTHSPGRVVSSCLGPSLAFGWFDRGLEENGRLEPEDTPLGQSMPIAGARKDFAKEIGSEKQIQTHIMT